MTQITRVFDNPGRAQAALAELKAHQFENAEVVEGPEGRGKTMLRVEAPFGTGVQVENILKRHESGAASPAAAPAKPAPAPAPRPATEATASSVTPPARPAGNGVKPPALAKPEPARPDVSTRKPSHAGTTNGSRTLSAMLGIPELIDSDTFFSGFPLLIRPTPKRAAETPPAKPN